MSERGLVDRKNEHLDIVLDPGRAPTAASTGLAEYRFVHCALPELHLDRIDLRTTLLGRALAAPLLISSMTGGAARASAINRNLAIAAQQLGIAFAVGSQRVALQSNEASGLTRELRQLAPDIPLLANIGATQLTANGSAWAERAVAMIEADALIIHINALQEAVQPEGDRDWRGVLAAIGELVRQLPVPVVAKEVGAGISPAVARRLREVGVTIIDVAGSGGTNWALVESARARAKRPATAELPAPPRIGHAFADWGIPTAEAIRGVRAALPDATLIASGGVRDGVDAAKAIRLGADLVGQAAALLAPALQSPEAVVGQLETVVAQLRIACFCTGSADLAALRGAAMTWRGELLV